ncbi:hypothetical protein ADL00_01520 [Streptomyces sp. AS58]|nr:hypothetical protein ADL00_01520 [Streptomyces sp. AS58]
MPDRCVSDLHMSDRCVSDRCGSAPGSRRPAGLRGSTGVQGRCRTERARRGSLPVSGTKDRVAPAGPGDRVTTPHARTAPPLPAPVTA